MDLYELKYQYLDSLNEGTRVCNLVCYDPETELGKKLASALENEVWNEVDDILSEHFGIKDDDVCFYFDWSSTDAIGHNAGVLITELQNSHDIHIYDYSYIEGV